VSFVWWKGYLRRKDIEIIPMEKIVTTLPSDTMGLIKLLPDYLVETNFMKLGNYSTQLEISHFYSSSKTKVKLLNLMIKPKIARETLGTLNAIKKSMENKN
jgi:NDP-sugar pyrophosphorylase family protein